MKDKLKDTDWRGFFEQVVKDEADTICRERDRKHLRGSCSLSQEYQLFILSWPKKEAQIPRNYCSDTAEAGWRFYGCLQYAHLRAGCSWRDGDGSGNNGNESQLWKLGERELQAVMTADGWQHDIHFFSRKVRSHQKLKRCRVVLMIRTSDPWTEHVTQTQASWPPGNFSGFLLSRTADVKKKTKSLWKKIYCSLIWWFSHFSTHWLCDGRT